MSDEFGEKEKGRENEIKVLFQILKGKDYNGIFFQNCNIDRLIQIAGIHRVSYPLLVFSQHHPDVFTPPQREALSVRCRKNALRSLDQLHELTLITQSLQKAGIPYAVIKGPQLARMVYGREALKESLDLDIMLVHEPDLERANILLSGLGFTQSNLNDYPGRLSRKIFLIAKREIHYVKPFNQIHIDFHIRAGSNTYLTAGLFRNFLNTLETFDLDGYPVHILPPEQYLVYLCYHGSLHQFSRLAWLLDIRTFLSVKRDILDFDNVLSLACNINAERSLVLTMNLLNQYFGDEVPAVIEKALAGKNHINYLAKSCRRMLFRQSGYGLTLQGRMNKLIYMMVLIRGFAGRLDLLYGIIMRIVANRIKK